MSDSVKWIALYQGHTERERYTYRATICDLYYSGLENIPQNAMEFAEWLNDMLLQIPEEHRGNAVLVLSNNDCDECSFSRAKFELYVDREETDDEFNARMQEAQEKRERDAQRRAVSAANKAKEKEEQDRAEYERLKKKYE